MASKKETSNKGPNSSKNHKKWIAVIVICLIAIVAIGSSSKPNSTNTTTSSAPAKKASFQGYLYATGDTNNISMTRPSGGWDNNDGWDTNAQATIDDASSTAVTPAVVLLNSHQLELYINVKNTGNAPGTASCEVQASSATGNDLTAGQFYGVNYSTPKTLNGDTTIQPGQYGNDVDTLTISGQGAENIQQIKISC